ncbi:MAG: carboxypeptidase-like regulatory domain-containing protein [Nitrospirota bacterium]
MTCRFGNNLIAFLLLAFPLSTFAYETASVRNGGTLSGTVTLRGVSPPPVVFRLGMSPFSRFCEKISDGEGRVVLEEYNVSAEGTMQDTIVAIQDVKSGKVFKPVNASFFATDCMFHPQTASHHEMYESNEQGHVHHVHPLVAVFQDRQRISVVNQDPISHNGQLFQQETGHVLLNFPIAGKEKSWGGIPRFENGKKFVQMICGMHEYMQTYGMVVDNPYYAQTKKDGFFQIEEIPEGTYQVMAWHPHFKPIIKEIVVSKGAALSLNFEFESESVRTRVFESADSLRLID